MRLHHLAVVCRSQENADRFYQGVLGLKRIKNFVLNRELAEQLFDISRKCQVILYGNDNFALEVFVADPVPGKNATFEHFCLEVEDKEEFVKRCEFMHVELRRIPKGEALLTFVKDYDGNLFEIKERPG
ncbi:MAG: VOC family protein [Desulfobacterales bacterium]|nr:VOC family protein [Desulfobacterales bacterium]